MNEFQIARLKEQLELAEEKLAREGGWRYRLKKWYYHRVRMPIFYRTGIRLPF